MGLGIALVVIVCRPFRFGQGACATDRPPFFRTPRPDLDGLAIPAIPKLLFCQETLILSNRPSGDEDLRKIGAICGG